MTGTRLGTPVTMAPEMIEGKNYSSKTDLWSIGNHLNYKTKSLGIILYQLLFGQYPFFGLCINEIYSCIKKSSGKNLILNEKVKISSEMKNLLQTLLEMNPNNRISWKEFFNHNIFEKNKPNSSKKISKFSKEIFENNFKESNHFFNIKNEIHSHKKIQSHRDIFSYAKEGINDSKIDESYFMSIKNTPKTKNITTYTPTRKTSYAQVSTNKFSSDYNNTNEDNEDKKTQKRFNEKFPLTNDEYFSIQDNSNREISPFRKSEKIQKNYSNDKNTLNQSRAEVFSNKLNEINKKYFYKSI